jgi:hypothetical protein
MSKGSISKKFRAWKRKEEEEGGDNDLNVNRTVLVIPLKGSTKTNDYRGEVFKEHYKY